MAESPATQIIDAHHHLWRYSPREYGWITPDMEVLQRNFLPADLAHEMSTAGVDGSVVVQARQTVTETSWLLDLAEKSPSILGVVGWVPLMDNDLPQILKQFAGRSKLKGVRHVIQDEPEDDFILRQDFNRGVARLLDTGLVYEILVHPRHLPFAASFVAQHPHQSFVLDHLAKPPIRTAGLQPWHDDLRRLADFPNISCKLSGMVTEADWATWTLDDLLPYLDVALEAFGPERLMAGSDWPVCLLASSYKRWWAALHQWCTGLTSQQCAQILGITARRVYQLD